MLDEHLLYVLYIVIVKPVRFMRLYKWRLLTESKLAAQARLLKSFGYMMGIGYAEQLGKSEENE